MADIKNEPCVFYVGRELSCNGLYYRNNSDIKDVFLNSDGTAKTNAKNPTNADAYVYAYDNNNKLNLHIFKSCCYDKMICKYKAPDYVNEPLKLMSNVDGIWSKEIDCRSGETPNEVIDADGTPYLTALVDYDDGFRISDNISPEYINPNQEIICRYDFVESYFMDSPTDLERTGVTGSYRFSGCTRLTECQLLCSMLTISDGTFSGCTNLVKYGNNSFIREIGADAFRDCINLPKLVIGENVISISNNAFRGCSGATVLVFNGGHLNTDNPYDSYNNSGNCSSLSAIPNYCFYGCSSLQDTKLGNITLQDSLVLPSNIKTIGDSAFQYCSGFTNLYFNKQETIGRNAFRYCTKISSIDIPDSVTSIGAYAFDNCVNSNRIIIPDSVTSIGEYAFDGCNSVSYFYYDSVVNPDDEIFNGWQNSLTTVEIGDNAKSIGYGLFSNCTYLTNVTIGNSVEIIDEYSFNECHNLTYINISNSVTSISNNAFDGCSGLTSITIPNADIEVNAFYKCSGLTDVTIGDGTELINTEAFQYCTSLTSVTIGNGARYINDSAFEFCNSLESVTIGNSIESIGSYAFGSCSSLREIRLYATTAPRIYIETFDSIPSNGTLYVPYGSSGYDSWLTYLNNWNISNF